MHHCVLFYTPIPVPKAIKIPAAKAAVNIEWSNLNTLPAWSESQVRANADVTHEDQNNKTSVHVATLMDLCHMIHSEMAGKVTKDESCFEETMS